MNSFIDIYCERLGPGIWAEPVNALTNLSFFIAALLAFLLARRENQLDWRSLALITLIAIIGAGSTAFHTLATFWAMMSDSLPILFYQIAFIVFYARYVMQKSCWISSAILGGFLLTMVVFYRLPDEWLNGSLGYAPAILFLFGFSLWHWKNASREPFALLIAVAVFALSLAFRSIDMSLCEAFPLGTHFMWHLLNGAVLYLTTRAYILNADAARRFTCR